MDDQRSTPTLRLLVFGPVWGAPSLDAPCTKAIAVLIFAGLREGEDFTVEASNNPHRSLGGELPVLELCSTGQLAEGRGVFAALSDAGYDPDTRLNDAQRADSMAFTSLIEETLNAAILYTLWEEEDNYEAAVRPALATMLPLPLCLYLPWSLRRRVHSQLARRRCLGKEATYRAGEKALAALSTRLGSRNFFHGDAVPTSVDASAFAYLSTVLRCPLPVDRLRAAVRGHENLVTFCERISSRYFGGSVPLLPPAAPPVPLSARAKPIGMAGVTADAATIPARADGVDGTGGAPVNKKSPRTPKQEAFRRRSRNAVLGAVGGALLYALSIDAFRTEEGDGSDGED